METDAAVFFNPISGYVFFVRATLIKMPTCFVLKFTFLFHTILKCIFAMFLPTISLQW